MIYLDYAATTPCDPAVVEAMLPFFSEQFGNASSIDHIMGGNARKAVDEARARVASLVGAKDEDVIFTSGSTESNNLVLAGTQSYILTSSVEHPSVLEAITKRRTEENFSVLPVTAEGLIEKDVLEAGLSGKKNSLVSIIHTNNETGSRNDVDALSQVAHEAGASFHSDISQALVTTRINFRESALDAISVSGHKIYGPKGVGALICKGRLRKNIMPLAYGGGHERGMRSGTLNVPGIVGFGVAASILERRQPELVGHLVKIRQTFVENLLGKFSRSISINGGDNASPHVLSLTMHGVNNRALLRLCASRLCFSLGSACATNKNEPSHVLKALGLGERTCNETIRVSFGGRTTIAEVSDAAALIAATANGLLEMVA